jgi:hypothetical protein
MHSWVHTGSILAMDESQTKRDKMGVPCFFYKRHS